MLLHLGGRLHVVVRFKIERVDSSVDISRNQCRLGLLRTPRRCAHAEESKAYTGETLAVDTCAGGYPHNGIVAMAPRQFGKANTRTPVGGRNADSGHYLLRPQRGLEQALEE